MLLAPDAAMAWADRLYAPLRAATCEAPVAQAGQALEAYRALSRRYPNDLRPHVGAARCLFRMGRYGASVSEYLFAKGPANELATAIAHDQAARAVSRDLPKGHSVRHVVRLSRDRWSAVTTRKTNGEDYQDPFADVSVRPFHQTGTTFRPEGRPLSFRADEESWREVGVFSPPALRPAFIVQGAFTAASCLPNDLFIVGGRWSQPRVVAKTKSILGTRAWMKGEKLCISVEPTYKVYWKDVYEWSGGKLRFANRHHPGLYEAGARPWKGQDTEYTEWMWCAAVLTIQRKRGAALRAWQEAERCARGSLREQAAGRYREESKFPDYGMYGDTRENLGQIRQRITWLRHGDWNHRLLYRPYDAGLQVPPYQLGKAMVPFR